MQLGSPAWVEGWLQNCLDWAYKKICRGPQFLWRALAAAVIAALIFSTHHEPLRQWWLEHNPYGFAFLSFHWPGLIALLVVGTAAQRLNSFFQIAIVGLAYFVILPLTSTIQSLVIGMGLSYALPILVLFALRQRDLKIQVAGQILAAIGAMVMINQASGWSFPAGLDRGWWGFRPERYVMVTLLALMWRASSLGATFGSFLQNPLHLVYCLPVTTLELPTKPFSETNRSGLLLVTLALFAFALGGLARNLNTYLYFYFNSWAVLNLIVGLGRWLGHPLKAPFYFALLAVSPAECWRRWNIPFYQWFRSLIFGPIWRKTRSTFLAVFAVFGVSFWLHDGYSAIHLWHEGSAEDVDFWVRNKILFFSWHGVGVYLALILTKYWPSNTRLMGWLGVLITWIWMVWVHTFVRGY